jgi:adenylosuccinate synthase
LREQSLVEPVYEEMEGWAQSTHQVRAWSDLPPAAMAYVRRIESLVGAKIVLVSTSPKREDIIVIEDPFGD